jgi:Flp pilus assembly protein TadD
MKKGSSESRPARGLRVLAMLGVSAALAFGGVLAVANSGRESIPAAAATSVDPLAAAKVAFADRDYARAETLARAIPGARALLGRILVERGRIAEARDLFSALLTDDPQDVDALRGMGTALLRMGQGDLAITHFQRAAKLRGSDPTIWKELGMAQREKGDSMGALASFQKSLSLDGKQEDLLNLLSELAAAKQDLPGLSTGMPKGRGPDPKSLAPTVPRPYVPDPNDQFPKPYWKNR